MRALALALAALTLLSTPAAAQTKPVQPAAPAAEQVATTGYTIEDTSIGTLLDDPAAKAVLDKNIPGLSTNEQIDMARSMTLKMVQQYAPDKVTDKALADVQADLAKLPVRK